MNSSSHIIINADDFGLSSAVNEAVFAASEHGILSSATIMANMPGFDEAAKGARGNGRLGVGVHLNLLRGSPISEPSLIHTLVRSNGKFLGNARSLALRILFGRLDPLHVETELCAQVEKVISCGIKPTHLDSEKHMHLASPMIGKTACRVAKRFGIRCIRVARELEHVIKSDDGPKLTQRLKSLFISSQSRRFAKIAAGFGLKFTDSFFGISFTGRMTQDVYHKLFSALPCKTLEIMTHPAASAGAANIAGEKSWLDCRRVHEYRALLDASLKDALIENEISLITYDEL
ncbi:MAG: ChbG/HpnK family deacetylase [Pseudomonadota bacterium]